MQVIFHHYSHFAAVMFFALKQICFRYFDILSNSSYLFCQNYQKLAYCKTTQQILIYVRLTLFSPIANIFLSIQQVFYKNIYKSHAKSTYDNQFTSNDRFRESKLFLSLILMVMYHLDVPNTSTVMNIPIIYESNQ